MQSSRGRACGVALALLALAGCSEEPGRRTAALQPLPAIPPAPRAVVATYATVVERVAPSVVTIRSERRVRAPRQHPFLDDPAFREFFGEDFHEGTSPVRQSLGSGVIVSRNGFILTNHHVVDGAEAIEVELNDRRTLRAVVVGSDPPSDIAVLRVDAAGLPALPLGDSDRVRVGDVVLALGNPLGVGQAVTAGIISARGRSTGLSDGSFEDFLQTDAPINRGNSGGALVNTAGEWIGLNSQIVSPSGGNIGIGFAIPSNMARDVMDQLVHDGRVRRGQLGVSIQPVTGTIAEALRLPDARGVVVTSVLRGGPAERAGIRPGDVIVSLEGRPVDDPNALRNRVAASRPGRDLTVEVVRRGRRERFHVRIGELRSALEEAGVPLEPVAAGGNTLGVDVRPLTAGLASRLGIARGVEGVLVVRVDPLGAGARAGIVVGDVIEEVNGIATRDAGALREALQQGGGRPALLRVHRAAESQDRAAITRA